MKFGRLDHISVKLLFSQSVSHVWHIMTPWTAAHQASLSFNISRSLHKHVHWVVMPSNHLILCHSILLLPSDFPNIGVFSDEPTLCVRWVKYWSFSFSTSPSSEYSGLISFRIDWLDLLSVQVTLRVFSSTTVWRHQFFSTQPSLQSNSHICAWLLEKPYLWLYTHLLANYCLWILICCLGWSRLFFQGASVF